MIMHIAEKFGRSPSEVENWDAFWFTRCALMIEGEHIYYQEQQAKVREQSRRGRRTS